jgi:hypothetical protein
VDTHDLAGEIGDHVGVEAAVRNRIIPNPEGRDIVIGNRRRSPQRVLWKVEALIWSLGIGHGARGTKRYHDLEWVHM